MEKDLPKPTVAVDDEEEIESEEALETKKFSLIELFSQMFIKENLDKNVNLQKYLVSASQTIPMSAILQAPEVIKISSDEKTIRDALTDPKLGIMITEAGIKLIAKQEQNTIILRDISSQTPSEEIMGIFRFQQLTADADEDTAEIDQSTEPAGSSSCPPVQSVRSDMNDTWFVTFVTEADARTALALIKNKQFNGNTIKARLKTETMNKSYFSAKTNPSGSYPNQGAGSHSNNSRGNNGGGNFKEGHDRNGNGNNRSHGRQGNGMDRVPKEYYSGPNSPIPHYMPSSHNENSGMPGMFFGSYPVPPPPPYMGMGMNPMNIPSMQIISSYPIVMNTQTGVMQWASPHPHAQGPGTMPSMHQGQGQGPMRSHTVSGSGTPNQQYLRPRTRSNPQTPKENASYSQNQNQGQNQGGLNNGQFKMTRNRGMSVTGSPMGMSYPNTPPGPGMSPQGMYFSQQYVINDGMNMNMNMNMNYRYQNQIPNQNQNQGQNGINEYIGNFPYQGGSPRSARNGNSKFQNRFPNVPPNQLGSPSTQFNRKAGGNQGQGNNYYQNSYDDKSMNSASTNGNGSGNGHGNGKKNSAGNLSQRSDGSDTFGPSNGGDSKSLIGAPSTNPPDFSSHPDNIQSGTNGFTIGIVTGTGIIDGHSDPSKYSNGRVPRHQSTTTSYAYTRQSRVETTGGGTEVGYVDFGRLEETTKKFSLRTKNAKSVAAASASATAGTGTGEDGVESEKHGVGVKEPRERDQSQKNKDNVRERNDGKEKGEGREKGSARTRDRPVNLKVPQSSYNLESDFPNLVEGDTGTPDSLPVNPVGTVSGQAGYATVAKRGVQELDNEPSPTSAAIQSSSFERSDCVHGGTTGGSNPGPKKSTAIKITPSTEHENNVSLALPGVPGRGLSPTSQVINTESPKDISHITGSAGAGTETPTSVPSGVTAVPTTSKKLYGNNEKLDLLNQKEEGIIFGEFKAPIALENVRSLHFGPPLSIVSPCKSPSTGTTACSPISSKISTSPKRILVANVGTTTTDAYTDTGSMDLRPSIPESKVVIVSPTSSLSSSSPTLPVPSSSPPAGSVVGTGSGTFIPETSNQRPQQVPSTVAPGGSVWGAKRSFLDVVRTTK